MGAAHPVRGQEGCHCRELNVFHHDIEIFGLDTGLQNTVHLNNPLLHHSPFAHGSVKKWGSLIKFFDYRNRAMDARAGELAPTRKYIIFPLYNHQFCLSLPESFSVSWHFSAYLPSQSQKRLNYKQRSNFPCR